MQLQTLNGYAFFDVSSAFQKCVRRGMEEDAMYWAVEFYISKFDKYLWKRMKIISSEDIGLADPNISSEIYSLSKLYEEQKKEDEKGEYHKTSHRLFLAHAVLMLCRAKKSRLIDHFQIVHFRSHHVEKKEIPDFAFDKHTLRGKRKNRGFKHFFEEGAKLQNVGEVAGEEEYLQKCRDILENPLHEANIKPDEKKDDDLSLF